MDGADEHGERGRAGKAAVQLAQHVHLTQQPLHNNNRADALRLAPDLRGCGVWRVRFGATCRSPVGQPMWRSRSSAHSPAQPCVCLPPCHRTLMVSSGYSTQIWASSPAAPLMPSIADMGSRSLLEPVGQLVGAVDAM